MKLYRVLIWVCAGLLVLMLQGAVAALYPPFGEAGAAESGDQEFKLKGNAAVSNYGSGEVARRPLMIPSATESLRSMRS